MSPTKTHKAFKKKSSLYIEIRPSINHLSVSVWCRLPSRWFSKPRLCFQPPHTLSFSKQFFQMGCCFSSNNKTPPPHHPDPPSSDNSRAPPPPVLEEETVKEVVLSEETTLPVENTNQMPVLDEEEEDDDDRKDFVDKHPEEEDISQMSEIYSFSESYSTTTTATTTTTTTAFTDRREDEAISKPTIRESNHSHRPPVKVARKRPEVSRGVKSQVKRSDVVGSRRTMPRNVGHNGVRRGGGGIGRSSGRVSRGKPSGLVEKPSQEVVSRDDAVSQERTKGGYVNESLDNPHVSLECFIFLWLLVLLASLLGSAFFFLLAAVVNFACVCRKDYFGYGFCKFLQCNYGSFLLRVSKNLQYIHHLFIAVVILTIQSILSSENTFHGFVSG